MTSFHPPQSRPPRSPSRPLIACPGARILGHYNDREDLLRSGCPHRTVRRCHKNADASERWSKDKGGLAYFMWLHYQEKTRREIACLSAEARRVVTGGMTWRRHITTAARPQDLPGALLLLRAGDETRTRDSQLGRLERPRDAKGQAGTERDTARLLESALSHPGPSRDAHGLPLANEWLRDWLRRIGPKRQLRWRRVHRASEPLAARGPAPSFPEGNRAGVCRLGLRVATGRTSGSSKGRGPLAP